MKKNSEKSSDRLLNNPRYIAILLLKSVLDGDSLTDSLPKLSQTLSEGDRRFTQHIIYGTLRNFDELDDRIGQMLQKPIKLSEIDVKLALLLAAYELTEMATAEYAAVNNWVNLIKAMDKQWAIGLFNAILRNIQRKNFPVAQSLSGRYNLPNWLVKRLLLEWKEENLAHIKPFYKTHPSMVLRVNESKLSVADYSVCAQQHNINVFPHKFIDSALILETAINVHQLPYFMEGYVSVQDASAQLAAKILAPQRGEMVLDACAAPGGKTTALLEYSSDIGRLIALDRSKERLVRVDENLQRVFGDKRDNVETIALACEDYQPSFLFDKILLDVPCSATGILHRHPDIKRLRKASDIAALAKQQAVILEHAWSLLKVGGRLLYATCSILQEENTEQIERFVAKHKDVNVLPLHFDFAISQKFGVQILPIYSAQREHMDGFYYCLLEKNHV